MIKKTFYNLPDEKRQRITEAIINEFSSSSTEKISINRIIKIANISRGSFYQYFDDKVDLVEVLMKTFIDHVSEKAIDNLKLSNGDVFYSFERMFDVITDFAKSEGQSIAIKNLMKNLHANDDLISEYIVNRFDGIKILDIVQFYNIDKLKFKDKKDIEYLAQILTQLLKCAVFDAFVVGKNFDEVKSSYIRKIEIIKNGASAE